MIVKMSKRQYFIAKAMFIAIVVLGVVSGIIILMELI